MKKEKRERKKMKEWVKNTIIVAASVFGFFFLTFVVTFLGGDLPWTAHRSSAIFVTQEPWYDYVGHEEAGQKCYFDDKDSKKRQEQLMEIFLQLSELGDRFGVEVYGVTLYDDKWLEVGCDEEDYFMARGLFNIYAKWYDIPIWWHFSGPTVAQ